MAGYTLRNPVVIKGLSFYDVPAMVVAFAEERDVSLARIPHEKHFFPDPLFNASHEQLLADLEYHRFERPLLPLLGERNGLYIGYEELQVAKRHEGQTNCSRMISLLVSDGHQELFVSSSPHSAFRIWHGDKQWVHILGAVLGTRSCPARSFGDSFSYHSVTMDERPLKRILDLAFPVHAS